MCLPFTRGGVSGCLTVGWFGSAGCFGGADVSRCGMSLGVPLRLQKRRLDRRLALGGSQECFGAVVVVDSGLSVVEVGWWVPFAFAAGVDGGVPAAVVDEAVVGGAGPGQVVDVGVAAFGPIL